MPNWVYNRLSISGDAKHLKALSAAIGSKDEAIDFPKLATMIPRTWDTRDERSGSRLEKIKGGGLVYFFDTAWGARPQLILDLSNAFTSLNFELYYIEEMEQFAGALICKNGKQLGEAYLGEEELEDFFMSSDEWIDEEEDDEPSELVLDKEALEKELLNRARAGAVIDWEGRKRKLELLRSDAETAALTRIRSRLQELTSYPKLHPPRKKQTDELLCTAIRVFEVNYAYRQNADIDLVPVAYLSEWVALQFCMTNEANFKKLPKSLKTQSFWDKFIRCKSTLSVYYNPELKQVPAKFRSDGVIQYALKHDIEALQTLKTEQRTPDRCKLAVQRYGLQLKFVPLALRTPSICRIAVQDAGMSLEFVPKVLRTPALCELATYKGKGYTAIAIQFVPKDLVTEKMFDYFIESPRGRSYDGSLEPQWIPKNFRSFELLKELLPTQPKLLSIVPPPMQERLWQLEGYPLRLVQSSGWNFNWFEHIPESARNAQLYEYVLQNHGANYYKSLPDQYKTRVLSLEIYHVKGPEILSAVPKAVFDQDFCLEILQSDASILDWRLNYKIKMLVEFLHDITAMHIPKEAWNAKLVAQAREQTEFSVLAFPLDSVTEQDFQRMLEADAALYYCFSDEVKQRFEAKFKALISDESSASHARISTVSRVLQVISFILIFNHFVQGSPGPSDAGQPKSWADLLAEINKSRLDLGKIGFHANSQETLLHWHSKIQQCRDISALFQLMKNSPESPLESVKNEAGAQNESLVQEDQGSSKLLLSLINLLTRLASVLEQHAAD